MDITKIDVSFLWTHVGLGTGFLVGAAVNAYVGHRLNSQPGVRRQHAWYFVPMQYISVLCAILGVISLFSAG